MAFMCWPPPSPDLSPCDVNDLNQRITNVVAATIERDVLTRVWDEWDYRVDICRVKSNSHVEDLYLGI